MKKTGNIFLLSAATLVLASCGGLDSDQTDSNAPDHSAAIEIIANYAKGSTIAPTVNQYTNAGISGITINNLDEINAIVKSLTYADVDTKAEIQVLVDNLGTSAPVITLTGDNPQSIELGNRYVELNAKTNDGSRITIDSSGVDTTTLGSYLVTYNATDANGNKAIEVSRTVNVVESENLDTEAPVITLKGENSVTLKVGDTYIESGATAVDNKDGNVSANIVIVSDTIDTSKVGQYFVTYNVSDEQGNTSAEVRRTVNVVESENFDTEAPVITLKGESSVTLKVGETYIESGATAVDNKDGNVSANIVIVSDTIDTSKVGQYFVTYNVSDEQANKATEVRRTINIIANEKVIQDWRIYDADPEGATIEEIDDPEKGKVLKFTGSGKENGYVYGASEGQENALAITKKNIKWSMKYNEDFTVFVRVMTTDGGRYLMYSNLSYDAATDGVSVRFGLGSDIINDTWQTIERDLEADLKINESNNSITEINGVYLRGSGLFDTIEFK